MDTISTVLSFLGALISAAIAWRMQGTCQMTFAAEKRVEREVAKLQATTARVSSLEAENSSLLMQLQKLRGQFFAFKSAVEDQDLPTIQEVERQYEAERAVPGFCGLYGQAQIEGPMSPAARCDCGYCVEMRARRERSRIELVPKTAKAQGELALQNSQS